MNWDRVEGNWKEFQGKVQQKWGKLTNDDMNVVAGKRTELSGRLQQRPTCVNVPANPKEALFTMVQKGGAVRTRKEMPSSQRNSESGAVRH